ncbi:YcjF family protein [Acanthopleuribacter pedis]|uniref:DUF697 domain-containing protein n=1 Tax=Acanthopleuribacter pedis TaxID=442870 RepID=A0A8J7U3Y8_9BACT|nr:DUF697 domain-containing protein [Acanthopleuribacter pedis]MBO1318808.1 DUF697 domain-containing protein [Acanthopleuribacter pedis]
MSQKQKESVDVEERQKKAMQVVNRYSFGSTALGLLPLGVVDLLLVGGVQVKMISELAKVYDLPFRKSRVETLIAVLTGALVSSPINACTASLVKMIPVVGAVSGAIAGAATSSVLTYALGVVFVQHFEAGGNVLNFDPEAMREFFQQTYGAASGERPVTYAGIKP